MVFARSLCLIAALLPPFALAQVPEAKACKADNESCREGCTLEFGTSFRTRSKLAACLERCRSKHEVCFERWTDVHEHKLEPERREPAAEEHVEQVRHVDPAPPAEDPVEGIILPTEEQLRGKKPSPDRREIPPEPEYDISEWDPDGD